MHQTVSKMKQESKSWLMAFLAGFLATVLGIVLTFGIESRINAHKKARTARLLAEQIVEKMDQTYLQQHEYLATYESIDSTSTCLHLAILADTLDRVDDKVVDSFLVNSLAEYVQVDVDSGVDAYRTEILNTIGDVELIGHIDQFYALARQCAKVSQQVIDQKRVVADLVYAEFYGKGAASTSRSLVRFLHELPQFNVFWMRMQSARYPLMEGDKYMLEQLNACKEILNVE